MKLIPMLRALHEIDQEWDEKGRFYQSARQQLGDESPLQAMREARLQASDDYRAGASKLRNAELELKSLQQKAQETETSLYGGRVRAFKELEDLRQEGEHLKAQITTLEDEILEEMDRVDTLRAAEQRAESQLQAFEAQWQVDRASLLNEHKALRARLQKLQVERIRLREAIPAPTLALYDETRQKKGGSPLAPLDDGRCQICRVAVPSSKVQAVLTDEAAIRCEGCDRILYRL